MDFPQKKAGRELLRLKKQIGDQAACGDKATATNPILKWPKLIRRLVMNTIIVTVDAVIKTNVNDNQ